VKAVQREIKYEEENYAIDDSVAQFLKDNGFVMKDEDSDNVIELTKKVGDTAVTVQFMSRSPDYGD